MVGWTSTPSSACRRVSAWPPYRGAQALQNTHGVVSSVNVRTLPSPIASFVPVLFGEPDSRGSHDSLALIRWMGLSKSAGCGTASTRPMRTRIWASRSAAVSLGGGRTGAICSVDHMPAVPRVLAQRRPAYSGLKRPRPRSSDYSWNACRQGSIPRIHRAFVPGLQFFVLLPSGRLRVNCIDPESMCNRRRFVTDGRSATRRQCGDGKGRREDGDHEGAEG